MIPQLTAWLRPTPAPPNPGCPPEVTDGDNIILPGVSPFQSLKSKDISFDLDFLLQVLCAVEIIEIRLRLIPKEVVTTCFILWRCWIQVNIQYGGGAGVGGVFKEGIRI